MLYSIYLPAQHIQVKSLVAVAQKSLGGIKLLRGVIKPVLTPLANRLPPGISKGSCIAVGSMNRLFGSHADVRPNGFPASFLF